MGIPHTLIKTGGIALILALSITAGPHAAADDPPGNNGHVKIHDPDTAVEDPRNEPHVCRFYVDGFGFDGSSSGQWWIQSWPPTGDRTEVMRADWSANASGDWHSVTQSLPDGHYKLFAKQQEELAPGGNKQKVFWVECAAVPAIGSVGTPLTVVTGAPTILEVATTVPTVEAIPLLGGSFIPANSVIILPSAIVLPSGTALAAGEIQLGTVLPAGTSLPAGTTFPGLGCRDGSHH